MAPQFRAEAAIIAVFCLVCTSLAVLVPWMYGLSRLAALSHEPDRRFAPENAAFIASGRTIDLVIIGDSRVARWTPVADAMETVLLRGIGGETTAQTSRRLVDDAIALKPRSVLILAGINDLVSASYMRPAQRAATVAATARRLGEMADRVAAAGQCTIVATVPPPSQPDVLRRLVWQAHIPKDMATLNAKLRAMASPNMQILDLAALLPVDDQGYLKASHAADTLHLNESAYRLLNRLLNQRWPAMPRPGVCLDN